MVDLTPSLELEIIVFVSLLSTSRRKYKNTAQDELVLFCDTLPSLSNLLCVLRCLDAQCLLIDREPRGKTPLLLPVRVGFMSYRLAPLTDGTVYM
jgi:hypothetical protein